tara:strand:+ start:1152 stop:2036 length:885 start_codon:yes stop_codon:yes gene_type:complete
MSIDVLSWDLFNNDALKRSDQIPDKVNLENRLIFETKNFFAVCGLGAFIEGYAVIITKDYLNSFAVLDSDELAEFDWISKKINDFYKSKYNKEIAIFEHGMCSCAGGLDHAHMHTIPSPEINENDLKNTVNKILKTRAAGINKIIFKENEFDNVHDIATIINFSSDYKITDGKLLEFNDINEFKGNIESIKDDIIKKEQYIYFNFNNKQVFTTNHYLGTQFGRELVYEIYLNKNEEKKKYFNSLSRSNLNKFIWRWQDYSFEDNILSTIKEMSNYLKTNINPKENNFGFKLRVK